MNWRMKGGSTLPQGQSVWAALGAACVLATAALTATATTSSTATTATPPNTPFPTKADPMSWKTECIGRVLIDMPTERARSWSSEFDDAEVRRLQRPLTFSEFWAGVETVRSAYAKQTHRKHPTRLVQFERMDPYKAAIVIGYDNDISLSAPWLRRFVHLSDQNAYEFSQTLNNTGRVPPTPALFKPYIDQYTPVLSRLSALRDGQIPSTEGLCFDGAIVTGDTGKNAVAALNVEIAHGTYLGLSYRENLHKAAIVSAFEELNRDQDRADFALTLRNEPLGYRDFKVLRRQERTLAGLRGQEFITRTTLNNGHIYYSMHWGIKGADDNLLTPRMTVHMNTPDAATNANGKPYTALPAEPELIALWDSALRTFRLRPGALPAGQVLRAVN